MVQVEEGLTGIIFGNFFTTFPYEKLNSFEILKLLAIFPTNFNDLYILEQPPKCPNLINFKTKIADEFSPCFLAYTQDASQVRQIPVPLDFRGRLASFPTILG